VQDANQQEIQSEEVAQVNALGKDYFELVANETLRCDSAFALGGNGSKFSDLIG